MSDCRLGVSPVNYPDPDPDPLILIFLYFMSYLAWVHDTFIMTHFLKKIIEIGPAKD